GRGCATQMHLDPDPYRPLERPGEEHLHDMRLRHLAPARQRGARQVDERAYRLIVEVHPGLENLGEQIRLGMEIVIDAAFGGAKAASDIVDRRCRIAPLHKAAGGRLQDIGARIVQYLFAVALGHGACPPPWPSSRNSLPDATTAL